MTEPASHAGFRDLARQALSRRTGIPAKTDWEVFLHGFASTNQLGGERERDIYECLLRTFPTPESVIDKDLRTLRNEEGCQNLISPVNSADWMKRNAENWDNIRPLLRCRTRAEQDAIRNFIEDPQNQNKRLVKEFVGANYKGSDMTLLWGGCEVPVVDKQLVRYLAPAMLGTGWDSYIRDQLSERKSSGRKLKLGRRFSADQGQDIQALDIDVDNPNHRYAEEEAIMGKIQSTIGRYGAWRDLAYQMADAEGIPANIWHVATWLEYRIGGDPDSPRANPRTLAQGREFADRTYAPSETPSAVTDDQMRYLNAEVNDRISYGLRNETVEHGRGPAYILSWSNASAEWAVFARREKVGSTVRLDANQILGYGNRADLDEAAPLLNPLPLYTGSFEYREQGKQDPGAMTPAHEKEYLEGMEGRRFPWGRPPLPHPPPHILGQLEELKTRAEKEAGMNPELYEDIVDWFLHHPDHNEIDLRTRGSHFEQAVGGHARAGGRVGASVGATVRHFSDKQLREYFAPLLEWTEIAGQNIPGHPHPRPRILRSKDRRTRLVGFTSPPHLADARARPPIGWKPLEQPRPRTDQPDYGYPPSEGYTGFPGAWADMTPEEQQRWSEEAEARSAEARRQIETQLGREEIYLDKDQWEIVMPTESLMQWTLPYPRGEFPHTPRLRETRKSIYYTPGWVKIRAYQVLNPDKTVGETAKDLGYSQSYVTNSLRGYSNKGEFYGPRLHAYRTPLTDKRFTSIESLTPEIQAEMVQTYVDHPDLNVYEIAEMYGYTYPTLRALVNKAGVERRGTKGATLAFMSNEALSDMKAKVFQAYTEHPDLEVAEIAEIYGINRSTIFKWLRAAGIERTRRLPRLPKQDPSAFVGFETPFGFDDAIAVMWKDWVQYKIVDTPVVVKRVGAKPGTKVNPKYKGATAAQELHMDFRLRASNRKDMQKIDFLLQRLREDNPTMNVRVNVKTNGTVAHRNLPSWQERPYRLEPAMFIGYESPDEYDSNITQFRWDRRDPHPTMEGHALITTTTGPGYAVETSEVEPLWGLAPHNPLGLSEEEREEYKQEKFAQRDRSDAWYDIGGVRVHVTYGEYLLGHNAIDPAVDMNTVNNAAVIAIQRGGGKPTFNTFRDMEKFLDRIKAENPGIRLFAEAKGDPVTIMDHPDDTPEEIEAKYDEAEIRSRRDIRARVYTRFGWEKLYELDEENQSGGWAMEYKPVTPSRVSTAFAGIEQYASAIMELV